MGTSLALSMNSLLKKNIPRGKIALKIVKRSIIIFAMGLMLSNGKAGMIETTMVVNKYSYPVLINNSHGYEEFVNHKYLW